MLGKDLIKMIQERGFEEYDFCITDRQMGILKRSATNVCTWDNAKDNGEFMGHHSYETGSNGFGNNAKVAILSNQKNN